MSRISGTVAIVKSQLCTPVIGADGISMVNSFQANC